LTAALQTNSEADNLIDELTLDTISTDTAVGHDSFIKDSFFTETRTKFSSPSQIDITEVGISEIDFAKSSISKYGSSKINFTKVTLTENSIGKVNPFQTTSCPETTFIHTRSNEFSETQVSLVESASHEVGIAEVSFSVDTTSNYSVNPVSTPKVTASEIFSSPSVPSEQFFSIHNSTPQVINQLNHSAANIWSNLLTMRGCDRIPSITVRSLRLGLRFTYTSDVTERSPKLGWGSLNPQLLIFRWKQECKPPLLLHPLGNG
jgi:hypothetical protein